MTIRHMNIFLAVYQTGSVTRAAEKLCMTQPAVTRAIKDLEHYYGVLLFERINQRLSVTEAGRQFYSYALHIIDSFDQMEKKLRNWDELGVIRVGASVTLGSMLLPKVLKAFQASHSQITIKATVTNGTNLQRKLEDNELDFALIEGGIASENLLSEEFSEDRLILLLPPNSKLLQRETIYLSDLKGYPLVLRENESVSRILLNHIFALHNLSVEPFMESVSVHAIVQAVHEGIGISFLPERLIHYSVASGFIATKPVADEDFMRKNYVVRHKNKLLTPSAKDFIALSRLLAQKMDD